MTRKLKIFLLAVTCTIIGFGNLSSATDNLPATPPDIARILKRGSLLVAQYKGERPPFFYIDEKGKLAGIDVDLARNIAYQLGVKAVFLRDCNSFEDVIDFVSRRKADIAVSKLTRTVRRARQVLFSNPYMIQPVVLVTNRLLLARMKGVSTPFQAAKVPGVKIGIVGGTVYVERAARLFPSAKVIEFPSPEKEFEALVGGSVLSILYDEIGVSEILWKNPKLVLSIRPDRIDGFHDELGIAVRSDSPQLLHCINLYLETDNMSFTVKDMMDLWRSTQKGAERSGDTDSQKNADKNTGKAANTSRGSDLFIAIGFIVVIFIPVALTIWERRKSQSTQNKTQDTEDNG